MGLLNDIQERQVTAFDVNGDTHELPLTSFKWRVSVYGVLIEDDKILVQRNPLSTTFSLPGGGLEMGEKVEDCLIREFKEETGIDVKPKRVINVKEDFYTEEGKNAFSVLIIYEVEKTGGELNKEGNGDDSVEVTFISKEELLKDKMQRVFKSIIDLI